LGGGRPIASGAVDRSNSRWPFRDFQISHGEIPAEAAQRGWDHDDGLAGTVTMPSWITPGDDHAHDGCEGQPVGLPVGHADEGPVAEPGDEVREDPGDGFTVT
jgi:hypothetical protein